MNFSRSEKLFILFTWMICFCIGSEYAITRPASNGIFLTAYSAEFIPWVWIATVPFNLLIVYLYNRFLPKMGPLKMVVTMASFAIGINLFCSWILPHHPKWIFLHYVWKDIYILFMFKQLWSMIHTTIAPQRSKYLYGIIFGMGTVGSLAGSLISGFFAKDIGSENLFLFTAPIYGFLIYCYTKAMKYSPVNQVSYPSETDKNLVSQGGVSMIFQNKLLISILCLVIFMQVSVALVEYQFNTRLEMQIFEKDLRTEYCGRIFGLTSFLSAIFQFIGSFLLVHWMGVRQSHLLIPLLLFINSLAALMIPGFALVTFSFILVKSIDFSLFGVIKEMLYIPLKVDEKYRAKAVIDVFAYRSSKALVSLAILGLQIFATTSVLQIASIISTFLFGFWLLFVLFFLKRDFIHREQHP